ncbi:MFS transporter [Streptomyces sp. NPDC005046]
MFRESAGWAAQKTAHATDVVSVGDVLTGSLRRTTLLGTLMAALALTGYWGATTWLPTYLHDERGLPSGSVSLFVTILNLEMFLGYNGFGMLADRIGRRRTIVLTLLGVAVTMPVYALTTHQAPLLWLGPLFGAFTAFFGLFGSYLGELFPTRARAMGAGFCFNIGRGVSAFAPFGLAGLAGSIGFSGRTHGVRRLLRSRRAGRPAVASHRWTRGGSGRRAPRWHRCPTGCLMTALYTPCGPVTRPRRPHAPDLKED